MTANELSKRFLIWFQKENPEAKIFRNNAGCYKTEAGNWIRYGIPNKGGSDFIAFVPKVISNENTRYLNPEIHKDFINANAWHYLTVQFYEIKTVKDKMSKDQIKFANMVAQMGGDYFIVYESKNGESNIVSEVLSTHKPEFFIEKWSAK